MTSKRSYHHYCPLAHALDLVGERWTLLIVRDLLLGPKRYKDLLDGLPGMGTNMLAARLKELEQASIIRRRVLPPPAGSAIYELTAYGRELEDILMPLARWGAKSLGPRQPEQFLRPVTLVLGLRERFNSEAACHLQAVYELRFENDEIYTIRIANGSLEASYGSAGNPDLVVTADIETFLHLQERHLLLREAITEGKVHLDGNAELFAPFLELFDGDGRSAGPSGVSGASEQ
jgi:DNA-binding HxlR family transcriptional regulator